MNYSEIKSNAAKIFTLETAIAEGYRALQSKLKDFQEKKIVYLQVKLNSSFAVLKAEAERLIAELRPVVETQDEIETVEQKTDEVIAFIPTEIVEQKINEVIDSLPPDTIVDNSAFGARINTGTADEKIWLVKKDGNGEGVTFVKTECGQDYIKLSAAIHSQNVTFVKTECGRYYESYAGDALRSIVLLGMPTFIWDGVLKTLVAVRDVVRLQEDAQKLGLTLHLYDRTLDTETFQDATTAKSELPPKFFSLNWQTLDFDSYDKPSPDQREFKPYPNIDYLIMETEMTGRYGLTALLHPSNHPAADLNQLIYGGYGLRVACDLCDIGKGFRSPYLFHESQLHRILR